MQFVFPSLAWGFLLVLAPVLIHLINLMRHRRTRWAAMDFLLESYRKHRRWVWLKQALLLLSRMAAMALLVAMLAQWISGSSWIALFGESVTHHYIVLDDSFSMSDTSQGTSAYQRGIGAIGAILRSAASQGGAHQVTLIRTSRAQSNPGSSDIKADLAADLLARSLPPNPLPLLDRLTSTQPTALDLTCEAALQLMAPLIESSTNQRPIVYIVSDFRRKDWGRPEAIRSVLEQMTLRETKVELIDCVDAQHQNLTIDKLEPEEEVLAAGIPLMVRVQIRNHGSTVARNVQVRWKTYEYSGNSLSPRSDQSSSGIENELQPLMIDQIGPGEVVARRVQAFFGQPGWHAIEARLPDDSVDLDNRSHCVVRIEEGQRVLLVDGDPQRRNAFFLEAIMNPGSNARTGLLTQREGPEYLRDAAIKDLSGFASIVLLDIARLEKRALMNLQEYAKLGGGIAIYLGNNVTETNLQHYNDDWYADGSGLLPCRLTGLDVLSPNKEEGEADMIPLQHPIFAPLLGLRNSPFQFLRISRYATIDSQKASASDNPRPPRIFAKLRNGAPWALDAPYQQGRVVLFLTGIGTDWTNWAQDPTFVVSTLKLVGFLGSFRRQEASQRIGNPLRFAYTSRDILPNLTALFPQSRSSPVRVAFDFAPERDENGNVQGSIDAFLSQQSEDVRNSILYPGIVELWSSLVQGSRQVQTYATTVSAAEGDLEKMGSTELQQGLRPVETRYRQAESIGNFVSSASLSTRSTLLMSLLLLTLVIEQFLAWSTSFHLPQAKRGTT